MQEKLSDRINSMATSQTLAMAAKARELKAEGKDIIGPTSTLQILLKKPRYRQLMRTITPTLP